MKIILDPVFKNVIATFILFFIVYDISFVWLDLLTTARIFVIILTIVFFFKPIKYFLNFIVRVEYTAMFPVIVCAYSLVLVSFSGYEDFTIFSRSFWFIVYCLYVPFLIAFLVKFDLVSFLRLYFLCAVVQSMFVYLSMLVPEYRVWLSSNVNMGGNIDLLTSFRSFGLSGGGGANLSLQLAFGFLAGLLFLHIDNNSFAKVLFAMLGLVIVFVAEIFVGRTGLLFCIVFLIGYLFVSFRLKFSKIIGYILAIGFGFILFINLLDVVGSNSVYDSDSIFEWAFSIFSDGGDGTASELVAQLSDMPTLVLGDFIFGTSRVVDAYGYNFSGSDSGYIQTFFALGLLMSFLFYLSIFLLLLSMLLKVVNLNKIVGGFIILSCFFVELKEPFMHKYSVIQFVVTLFLLAGPYLSRHNKQN